MATVVTYTASATVRCWKLHDCVGCGCVYRYKFEREVTKSAGDRETASAKMQRAVEEEVRTGVDCHPCPQCGLVQPRMVGHRKYRGHLLVATVSLIAAGTLTGIVTADRAGRDWMLVLLALTAAGAAVCHLGLALWNPNRSLAANLQEAEREVAAGRVEVLREGQLEEPEWRGRVFGGGQVFYLLLAGLAVAAALAPVVVARDRGWHQNRDVTPAVVAPGETVTVDFPTSVGSVNGLWSGKPAVTVENAADFGGKPPRVAVKTQDVSWARSVGTSGTRATQTPKRWADVTLPADDQLIGKTLRLKVDMTVKYPLMTDPKTFVDSATVVSKTVDVRPSVPGAREEFREYQTAGGWTGTGLIFLSGLGFTGLGWLLKRKSPPDLVQPFEERASFRGFGESRATTIQNKSPLPD